MKKILSVLTVVLLASFVLAACSGSSKDKPVATETYIRDLKKALQSRWSLSDSNPSTSMTKLVNKELEVLEKYDDLDFEDEELESLAQSYNDSLREQKKYSNDNDIYSENSNYQKAYRNRTSKIVTFTEEYGLEVDSKYNDYLEELVNSGQSAISAAQEDNKKAEVKKQLNEIFSNLQWTSNIENEYDETPTWKTTFTNTTDMNIVNVEYVVSFYDEEGTKLDSDSTGYLTSVNKGEKSQIKVDSYNVPSEAKSVKIELSQQEYAAFEVKE